MARYIDLEKFERRIKKYVKPEIPEERAFVKWCRDECIKQGYAMPTADVQEVRHAKFELIDNGKGVCSNCHRLDSIDDIAKYCRYCGARMDGDEK